MDHERIILILDYLKKNTHKSDGVTISDIKKHLSNTYNLRSVAALTIRRDIDRLTTMGYHIDKTNGPHNTAYYILADHGFTFNEIRFLVDSVSINKFLSNEQKRRLINKFEGMCSEQEIRQLVSRISLNGCAAPSLDLIKNLEIIHQLISEKRRINFEYGHFDENGNMAYYDKDRKMIPGKVVYFAERFYLLCMDEHTKEPRTYRIDRMQKITGGDIVKLKCEFPQYDGFVADMFPPDYFETITLRVNKRLLDEMIEQFGKHANIQEKKKNEEWCSIRVRAGINRQFYLWLMRYGNNIQVLSPSKERAQFVAILKEMLLAYDE